MCRIINHNMQARIIEEAKEYHDRVFAVMEDHDDVDELVGIIGILGDTLALLYDINDDQERSVVDKARYEQGMSTRTLRRRFGLTSMDRLVAR